jgi:hypothetical protein
MRHNWNYLGTDPATAKFRTCNRCPMEQSTFGVGAGRRWDWRMSRDELWHSTKPPACPEPTEPETEWTRVEDAKHPRWEIKNPLGDGKNRLCTDHLIRTYGRKHTEKLLAGLPPLPEKAWEILDAE